VSDAYAAAEAISARTIWQKKMTDVAIIAGAGFLLEATFLWLLVDRKLSAGDILTRVSGSLRETQVIAF